MVTLLHIIISLILGFLTIGLVAAFSYCYNFYINNYGPGVGFILLPFVSAIIYIIMFVRKK